MYIECGVNEIIVSVPVFSMCYTMLLDYFKEGFLIKNTCTFSFFNTK